MNKNCKEIFCANEKEGKNDICSSCRLKKWRKDNPKKVKAYAEMRYERDREKIMAKLKEANQKNGYAYDKTPERRENARIRRATRRNYPLEGNTCQFCDNPAERRHHTTIPIEVDKFLFLCKKHHDEIHGKRCVIGGLDE